ncbi:pimeloyl-ACP methyl ester carboxylesterase [Sphingomonas jinjuensis]|uniref:Pimeloyl-ACP methyl ester carboxylesterase n=1 Tax=Sphingomonas jinjuensis TaxID=535907 RepID=A0A840FF87_9SPHN|nr:pimeloyl-ACP methyl ester carboxylesterase [Sphingomonas jinjuensis]
MARIFYLHALGASAAEWDGVIDTIGAEVEHVALDLSGFGGSDDARLDVAGLVDWFADRVGDHRPDSWAVVGHSMGGKIATLAAARARDGDPAFSGLAAVVLLAASPPSPEPIDEERRAEMIAWFDDGRIDADEAATFVDANTATPLPDPLRAKAIADVQRSGREAWVGWLERGSREDWAEAAGVIAVPALIVAGGEDGDLGIEAQQRLNVPHYADARVEVVAGAAHLLPYERPADVAALIRDHVRPAFASALPADFVALLASDRVSRRTRAVMTARHAAPIGKSVLTERQRDVLAALVETTLPGVCDGADLARRIDAMLASGQGDGWRLVDLPADESSWAMALDTLASDGFVDCDGEARGDALRRIAEGSGGDTGSLTAAQMRLWFAEARAEIARQWMALPATMALVGYDGFAVGGDGERKQGYRLTAADMIEPWQVQPGAVA